MARTQKKVPHVVLLVLLQEKSRITLVIRIHPLGTKSVCTKYHDSPSSCCQDISDLDQSNWQTLISIKLHCDGQKLSGVLTLFLIVMVPVYLSVRVTWGFRYGCCVYLQTKGYCFRTFFGRAANTEYTEQRIHWTTWTIRLYQHCILDKISFIYTICICSFTESHLLFLYLCKLQISSSALKLIDSKFLSGHRFRTQLPKCSGEIKDGPNLPGSCLSDVEAGDEKAKGLKDEMIKIRVKKDMFNLL